MNDVDLQQRQTVIGASDLGALFGVDPRKTPYDLWAEKRGMLERGETTEAMRTGTKLEPYILDLAEERYGRLTRGSRLPSCIQHFAVNLDAYVSETHIPVEAKSAGILGPLPACDRQEWGEEGSAHVPARYVLQCHGAMLALTDEGYSGVDHCHLVALIGGRGPVFYEIPRNEHVVDAIRRYVPIFWGLIESGEIPPEVPSHDVLCRIKRVPRKTVVVEPALIRRWNDLRELRLRAEKDEGAGLAEIMRVLGDGEIADGGTAGMMTYLRHTVHTLNQKLLKAKFPVIHAVCSEEKIVPNGARYKKPDGEYDDE